MSIQRPRNSVLSMFDPLNVPSSPPRHDTDIPSGCQSDSDKENDTPPAARTPGKHPLGAMIVLCDLGTPSRPHFKQPRALRTRLIDVGDETMDIDSVDEQEAMDIDLDLDVHPVQAESVSKGTPSRVPFAVLERADSAPPTPQKTHAHSPFTRSPLSRTTPRRKSGRISSAFSSPFAAVINSITSEADNEPRGLPDEQLQDTSLPFSIGHDSSFERSLLSARHVELEPSFTAHCGTDPNQPTGSSTVAGVPSCLQASPLPDPARSSSFSIQRESSFDLVNDRLSFTSAGNDSMHRALEAARGAHEEEAMLEVLAAREVARMKREGSWTIGEGPKQPANNVVSQEPIATDDANGTEPIRVPPPSSPVPTEPASPSKPVSRVSRVRNTTAVPLTPRLSRSTRSGSSLSTGAVPRASITALRVTKRSAPAVPLSPSKREAKLPRADAMSSSFSSGPALPTVAPLRVAKALAPRTSLARPNSAAVAPSRVITVPKRVPLASAGTADARRPGAVKKTVSGEGDVPVHREMSGAAAVAARALSGGGERRASALPRPATAASRLPAPSARGLTRRA